MAVMKRIILYEVDLLEHWSVSGANLAVIFTIIDRGGKSRNPQRCKDCAPTFFPEKAHF